MGSLHIVTRTEFLLGDFVGDRFGRVQGSIETFNFWSFRHGFRGSLVGDYGLGCGLSGFSRRKECVKACLVGGGSGLHCLHVRMFGGLGFKFSCALG